MTGYPPDRRGFLGLSASALVSSALLTGPLAAQRSETSATGRAPQNLILFFPDELRADSLACYGNPVTRTPNFDLLAKQGTRFANCHVQNPVCAQSRCSMLTGWPTSVHGHRSLYYLLRRNEPNMFRYLKNAGYDVFWFGKNDALAPESFPDSVTEWHDSAKATSSSAALKQSQSVGGPTTMLFPGGDDRRKTGDYGLVQDAIRILSRTQQNKPFCIFLPMIEPHPPYRAPQGFDTMYNPANLPPLVPPGLPKKPNFHQGIRDAFGLTNVSDSTLREVRATYYGQVSYSDWLLGELMEAIERTGHVNDTALIVASDHADYAGDYGLVEKWPSGLESCLTHVPLLGRMPGGVSGHVVEEMSELFDVMPTMLDLGGTRATHTHFARNLVPQLCGAKGDPDRAAFSEGGYNVYEPQAFEPKLGGIYGAKTALQDDNPEMVTRSASVKTRQYTFIERPNGQSELYDRQTDPAETRNLVDERGHATVRTAMRKRLLDWYINTSGVPEEHRDARDMPTYYRDPVFGDAERRSVQLLDN